MVTRILYYDSFDRSNSNFFWKAAFEGLGSTHIVDCNPMRTRPENAVRNFKDMLKKFRPTHIHLGGSVKSERYIPLSLLQQARREFPECRITWFYGDAYNNSKIHLERIDLIDNIYITNSSHLDHPKAKAIFCPYDDRVYKPHVNANPKHDIVFVGNPHGKERIRAMEELTKKFDTHVFGNHHWKPHGVNHQGPLGHDRFSKTLSNYKIVLGDPAVAPCKWINLSKEKFSCAKNQPEFKKRVCRQTNCKSYEGLRNYFSNRLVNTLASQAFHLVYHVDGVEEMFENKKDLVFYHNEKEQLELIEYYLKHDDERREIAKNGYEKMKGYTFQNMARRIIRGES